MVGVFGSRPLDLRERGAVEQDPRNYAVDKGGTVKRCIFKIRVRKVSRPKVARGHNSSHEAGILQLGFHECRLRQLGLCQIGALHFRSIEVRRNKIFYLFLHHWHIVDGAFLAVHLYEVVHDQTFNFENLPVCRGKFPVLTFKFLQFLCQEVISSNSLFQFLALGLSRPHALPRQAERLPFHVDPLQLRTPQLGVRKNRKLHARRLAWLRTGCAWRVALLQHGLVHFCVRQIARIELGGNEPGVVEVGTGEVEPCTMKIAQVHP